MSTLYKCTLATCDVTQSVLYYRPSLAANVAFLAFFALSGILHTLQGIRTHKRAFWIAMAIGCVAEVVGYVGRLMGHADPFSENGFLIQICCLTIAPAFFAAAIYFTLGDIVRAVSEEASRLKPRDYAKIFITCDFFSLILQGTGGGLASVASQNNKNAQPGTHVMVAGLAFQVASLTLFIAMTLEFFWRVHKLQKRSPGSIVMATTRRRLTIFGVFFTLALVCIYIRCVYRVIELAGGWTSKLYRTQTDFIVLEGVMVLIAVYALHIGHPGTLSTRVRVAAEDGKDEAGFAGEGKGRARAGG